MDRCKQIYDFLKENHIYADVYQNPQFPDSAYLVEISWGDWKHEHMRTRMLLEEKFNATHFRTNVTEDDGSDTYSAVHTFIINRTAFEKGA